MQRLHGRTLLLHDFIGLGLLVGREAEFFSHHVDHRAWLVLLGGGSGISRPEPERAGKAGTAPLHSLVPDPTLYPEYDDDLKGSMAREPYLYFEELLKNDLGVTRFVASDFSLLNELHCQLAHFAERSRALAAKLAALYDYMCNRLLHANLALWQLVNSGKVQFVVNGHTHHRSVRSFGELTIINAGTLYRRHAPCFCIADFEQGFVQYFNVEGDGSIEVAEQFPIPPKTQIE